MKILSVNIEDIKHLDTVTALVATEKPTILFVQEVCEKSIEQLTALMGTNYSFAPMAFKDSLQDNIGIATFSLLPATHYSHLLKEADKEFATYAATTFEERFDSQNFYVIETVVTDELGEVFRFYNTQLPVTERGATADFQLDAINAMLQVLKKHDDAILVGDSNAPRGREAFEKLSAEYKDNIPEQYTTSIDGSLHRAGPLEFMVDVLFTTPEYRADNVRFISGVSDHFALCAEVSRSKE